LSPSLTVGSLFTGIGGIDIGLEAAGASIAWQSEIDPFCNTVLKEHWPSTPNIGDVTKVDWNNVPKVDIIAGGYPCPAFSNAARGRNNAPDLWPFMYSAIKAIKPRWVFGENVAAHLNKGFPEVLSDLADIGYDVEWEVAGACSFGAPHPRRRLFFIAYADSHSESTSPLDAEAPVVRPIAGHDEDWRETAANATRKDDGVPNRLDRCKALGNSVVPAAAEFFGSRIVKSAGL
jgi:DNA (cytosine-5)-methyltransferase 1